MKHAGKVGVSVTCCESEVCKQEQPSQPLKLRQCAFAWYTSVPPRLSSCTRARTRTRTCTCTRTRTRTRTFTTVDGRISCDLCLLARWSSVVSAASTSTTAQLCELICIGCCELRGDPVGHYPSVFSLHDTSAPSTGSVTCRAVGNSACSAVGISACSAVEICACSAVEKNVCSVECRNAGSRRCHRDATNKTQQCSTFHIPRGNGDASCSRLQHRIRTRVACAYAAVYNRRYESVACAYAARHALKPHVHDHVYRGACSVCRNDSCSHRAFKVPAASCASQACTCTQRHA
jgi:hypothetical protein